MGLLDDVRALRSAHWLPPIETVPEWVVYSLPDGMWLLSYMFAMEFIWNNDGKHIRLFFVWAMPVAIIAHEFCQLMGLASGTWDILDLTSYSIAIIIYLLTKNYNYDTKHVFKAYLLVHRCGSFCDWSSKLRYFLTNIKVPTGA